MSNSRKDKIKDIENRAMTLSMSEDFTVEEKVAILKQALSMIEETDSSSKTEHEH